MKESWSCNATAGRASLTFLDRHDLYNKEGGQGQGSLRGGPEMVQTKCQNLIVIATWTGLELERKSGLELRLPLSRIQKIEDRLPYPKQVRKEGSVREAAVDTHGRPQNEAKLQLFEAIQGLEEAKVWELVAHTWKATYVSYIHPRNMTTSW